MTQEQKENGLIAAYQLDGQGQGIEIDWEAINRWNPQQGLIWVHLDYTVPYAAQWLKEKSQLDYLTVQALLAEEPRPRATLSSKGVLVLLRGVNLNPTEDPEDMVSIRIWFDAHRVITTRRRRLLSTNDMRQAIAEGEGPKTSSEFLRMFNDFLVDRMSSVIEGIEEAVDELEEQVIVMESHWLRPKIADIRRQSIAIRRYLAPQREALNRLVTEESSFILSLDRLHLRESSDRIIRYIEDLDSARERAAVTQEELTSRLSEQMDRRMYILSVVAVIFLPLTFITGLLGINVGGIPGSSYDWAFLIVCSTLLVVTFCILWYFRKKQWI